MAGKEFVIGEPVWAKMKGFSAWPARIVEAPKEAKKSPKKPMHYVYFFGTENYAWIQDENIYEYELHKDENSNKLKKSSGFRNACDAIEKYNEGYKQGDFSVQIGSETDEHEENDASEHETENDMDQVNGDSSQSTSSSVNRMETKEKKRRKKKEQRSPIRIKKQKVVRESPEPSASDEGSVPDEDDADVVVNGDIEGLENMMLDDDQDDIISDRESPTLVPDGYVERPETPPLDIDTVSETLKSKKVEPTSKSIGFLGLGIMGKGIVKNLLHSGHKVTVWNRTPEKCDPFVNAGAYHGQTPADVVEASDITFCCVSDPSVSKDLVFGNCGVLSGLQSEKKGYVEMSSIDPETSKDIAEAITCKGGRYLEAPIYGSKQAAEEGTIIILAAGDRTLFTDCQSCFHSMSQHAFYIGNEVGNGAKMNLIFSTFTGVTIAALAEAVALVDRNGLCRNNFMEILELGTLNCPEILRKADAIIHGNFLTNMPLQHMQKDIALALGMGEKSSQPLPVAAAANEIFKIAKLNGYSEHDVSAVFKGARP